MNEALPAAGSRLAAPRDSRLTTLVTVSYCRNGIPKCVTTAR